MCVCVCVCVCTCVDFPVIIITLQEMVNKVEYIITERPSVEVTPITSAQEELKACLTWVYVLTCTMTCNSLPLLY